MSQELESEGEEQNITFNSTFGLQPPDKSGFCEGGTLRLFSLRISGSKNSEAK